MVFFTVIILSGGIHVLNELEKYQTPPLRPMHPKYTAAAFYAMVYVAGLGYRRSLQLYHTKKHNI